jgi:hypothetical protein
VTIFGLRVGKALRDKVLLLASAAIVGAAAIVRGKRNSLAKMFILGKLTHF